MSARRKAYAWTEHESLDFQNSPLLGAGAERRARAARRRAWLWWAVALLAVVGFLT